jgi:eukaryotic-like serine/threonine-protein kinase
MGSTDARLDAVLASCKDSGGNCTRTSFATEQPTHTVALDAFWIDETEVTNAQFAAFLNAEGVRAPNLTGWVDLSAKESQLEKNGSQYQAKQQYADHPVVLVSWEGANAYCQWAGARLPTEAQWEYAARGPQGNVFPWENDSGAKLLNYASETDGYTETAPVGSFAQGASWTGALDMAGNVAEWVSDFYGTYPTGRQSNPVGPANGELRVTRGGSYLMAPYYARGASRGLVNSSDTNRGLGFRCARRAEVPTTGKVPSEHAG